MAQNTSNIPVNWFDRCIGWLSPRAMYSRMQWRAAIRNYDAGGFDRLNSGWNPVNQSGQAIDRGSRDTIRARARDLERNSDVHESIVLAYTRNVIGGTGFTLQSKVCDANGEEDDAINSQIEVLWQDWCRPRNCDTQGRLSFVEMCRMIVRRKRVDGGIFVIKNTSSPGAVPLSLQLREVDELDTSYSIPAGQMKNGNYIVDGVEVDRAGRHVAYYFRQYSPDGFATIDPVRVPAKRVIYLQHITRPSQVREMSPMAVSISRIRDLKEYLEAVIVQSRVAACLVAFVKKIFPGNMLGRGSAGANSDSQSGYNGQTMTPGMIMYGSPGEEVQTINPPSLGSSAREFSAIEQRLAGAGQGVSYEASSRDMSQVNYSSARQGLLEDQETYREEQQYLIDHLLYEVYTEWLIRAALAGVLPFTIAELLGDKPRYMAHQWIPRGWSWIDPLKEVTANAKALDSAQVTLAQICAERGLDWREVIRQRGRERQAMLDAGLISEPVTVESTVSTDTITQ